jgi:hypothetical protein
MAMKGSMPRSSEPTDRPQPTLLHRKGPTPDYSPIMCEWALQTHGWYGPK